MVCIMILKIHYEASWAMQVPEQSASRQILCRQAYYDQIRQLRDEKSRVSIFMEYVDAKSCFMW